MHSMPVRQIFTAVGHESLFAVPTVSCSKRAEGLLKYERWAVPSLRGGKVRRWCKLMPSLPALSARKIQRGVFWSSQRDVLGLPGRDVRVTKR